MHWSFRRHTSTQNTSQKTRFLNVDFDSNGLLFLFLYISEKYLQFNKKQGKTLGSTHTAELFFKLYNLKEMCITLKGIGKILLVSVLRILLICKFLNFTAVFTKKHQTFQSLRTSFLVRELISV